MNVLKIKKAKDEGQKLAMVTCYDYTLARLISETEIDLVLVGDSAGMVMHGLETTIGTTVEMMELSVRAVARGISKNQFLVADVPFMEAHKDRSDLVETVQRLVRSGAQAVKIEGGSEVLEPIQMLTQGGVPVMGHLGLLIQHYHQLGGFRVQGKTEASRDKLIKEAIELEKAGCFSLVLECIPAELAKEITETVSIPTIGIGAGAGTDGQVLVLQDMLGMYEDLKPKFVKQYMEGASMIRGALNQYASEVKAKEFPGADHAF